MTINITDPQQLLIIFGLGIVIRSFYALRRWQDLGWWLGGWFFAVLIVARIYEDKTTPFEQELLAIFLAFAFGIALFLYKNILPRIREHSLLFLTLIFLYCFIKYVFFTYPGMEFFLVLVLIPSISIVYLSFVNLQLSHYFKLFFYVWFIVLNLFFILFYLFSKEISLWDYSRLHFASPYEAFLTGFTAFSLMTNFCFIYLFIFPGDENDTWQGSKRKWREYADILISRHEDSQLHHYQSLLILVIVGGGLVLNYYFNFVSDDVLIPAYLFLSQFFIPTPPINKNVVKPQILSSSPA